MSVYTQVGINDLTELAQRLKIGAIRKLSGITDGVVNTNYRLDAESGSYVLTLVENPAEADALPFVAGLLVHLAKKGIPCPQPITDHENRSHFVIKERPAMLASFLAGRSPQEPSPAQSRAIGAILAQIHLAGADYPLTRENPMGPERWQEILEKISPALTATEQNTFTLLQREYEWLKDNYLGVELPVGVCHADLFCDNSFFIADKLTGVIDFFYACNERYIYDLAVALNAWSFDQRGLPRQAQRRELLEGYQSVRPLSPMESRHLNSAARAAALRFSLSRLHDNLFPRPGETVTRKDPRPFLEQLKYFRSV